MDIFRKTKKLKIPTVTKSHFDSTNMLRVLYRKVGNFLVVGDGQWNYYRIMIVSGDASGEKIT